MSTFKLPTPDALGRLLGDLTGATVQAKPAKPLAALPASGVVVATYVDAAGKICAASIFDIGAAASLAAALTVLLPAQARASVDAKKLDQGLFENLREICNVTVTAFVTGGASQLSLSQLYDKPAELPPEAAAIVKKPSARLDTTIAVRGYPGGYLALLCA